MGSLPNVIIPIGDDATISLHADPSNLTLIDDNDSAASDITAQLMDNVFCPISKGIMQFGAQTAGHIGPPSRDTTDSEGFAEALFWIIGLEVQGGTPPQVTGVVVATLVGYPTITSEIDIVCTKTQ